MKPKRVERLRSFVNGLSRTPARLSEVIEELDGASVMVKNDALVVVLPEDVRLEVSFLPDGKGIVARVRADTMSEARELVDVCVERLASI